MENGGKSQQACDNCRCRKIKCDRGSPCNHCIASSLPCQYLHVVRRKGPKRGVGRRLTQLRKGYTEIDKDCFNVVTPSSPSRLDGSNGGKSNQGARLGQTPSWCPSTTAREIIEDVAPSADIMDHPDSSMEPALSHVMRESQLLALSLVSHVQAFLKHMFPIMPVVDGEEILADAARLDELAPSRYALIVSLCAATRIQLRLDDTNYDNESTLGVDIPPTPQLSGEMLLSMAEMSLCQISIIDDHSLDSLLASFFLFAGYGNLNNPRRAWFYLNQCITLAQAHNITNEDGYLGLSSSERELKRRIFWLLFVTERTFALQHRRSVMIRNRITKPQIVDSECPAVMHDFINHLYLFEALPCSLYEWHPDSETCHQTGDSSLTNTINTKLCALQPGTSVIESQRFDSIVTQQWLRVSMWRLAYGKKPGFVHSRGLLMPAGVPLDAGKVVMVALNSVGQSSKDCHGIGMEQKLFDIGTSLVDSALLPASNYSSWEIGPQDLLCAVIKTLSKFRGGQSYLLPPLLQHSEELLGYADPAAHIDLHWTIFDTSTTSVNDSLGFEEPPQQANEPHDAFNWAFMEDIGSWDLPGSCLTLPSSEREIQEEPSDPI